MRGKLLTFQEFVNRANIRHNNFYDYSKVVYKKMITKLCIICPIHGEFWQTPEAHLYTACGCPKCGSIKIWEKRHKPTTEEFINKAILVHGNKYNYTKVKYVKSSLKVCIICPIHGEFWQSPANHLSNHGCAKCNNSRGEEIITEWLNNQKISYELQYKFSGLIGKRNRLLMFDFYVPSKNLLIEFDGRQHFKPERYGKLSLEVALKKFKALKHNDELKDQYCEKNAMPLLRISYKEFKNISEILAKRLLEDETLQGTVLCGNLQ